MQVGVECKKKLSTGEVPQLETRAKRRTDYVCYAENWQNGTVHERFRGKTD